MMSLQKIIRGLKFAGGRVLSWVTSPYSARLFGEPLFWLLGFRRRRQELDLSQVKRVLTVRSDEIGDVVLTTPFLRELRGNLPNAWITLVVKPATFNLVELCPYVNEVLTYDLNTRLPSDRGGQRYFWQMQQHRKALGLALRHFWRRRFDLAILPRWDADYYNATFISYISGAPWRVGYSEDVIDYKRQLNGGYDQLLTHALTERTLKHEVERSLDVIRYLGGTVKREGLELWVSHEDEAFAEDVLNVHGIRFGKLLVAFGPGARIPRRMWPLANFIELGTWLKSEYDAVIVVVGKQGEERLGKELQRKIGDTVINVVGQTSLRETSALLKRCQLCVSNDAGVMHLAAAAGVAIVEISCHPRNGSELHVNSPKRFAPWGVPYIVLQPGTALDPCSEGCDYARAHCILGVGVDRVKEAVAAQLSQQGEPTGLERVR